MHDSLLGYAFPVCCTSVFQRMLQRRPYMVASCRLLLLGSIWAGRFSFHANQFQNLGLAKFVGDLGRVGLVRIDGSLGT